MASGVTPKTAASDLTSVEAVAERLRLTREALGYPKQAPFARWVGIEEVAYSQFDRGCRRISLTEAFKVVR